MIRLNVFIRTTATNREETVATAKELVAASLKDAGCVAYDLFESAIQISFAKPQVFPRRPRLILQHDLLVFYLMFPQILYHRISL